MHMREDNSCRTNYKNELQALLLLPRKPDKVAETFQIPDYESASQKALFVLLGNNTKV